ncbi:hypothetical protein ACRS43_12710 [Enterobacter cloacae]
MSELFLSVFGVATAIAFIFYKLGYTQGHRAAHCGNAVHSMAELEKAVRSASEALKLERASADFYRTRCKEFDELNELFNENLEVFQKYVNELRGDIIEADTFNREMLKSMNSTQLFNKTNLLMIGEQLEQADFKLSSEAYRELADKYREYDKQEVKDDIEFACNRASRKRQVFIDSVEQGIVG